MILLLDMDGPLADFDGHFWQRCLAEGWSFDIDHPHQQTYRYFTEHMPDREQRRLAREMVDSAGWFEDLPVTEGALKGIEELLACPGVDLWVCTKPLEVNPTCRDAKGAWLRRHFGHLHVGSGLSSSGRRVRSESLEHRLIVAPDKSLVRGDFLLDDAPHPAWFDAASWRPIVFDAPYNRLDTEWEGLPRWHWSGGVESLVEYMERTLIAERAWA